MIELKNCSLGVKQQSLIFSWRSIIFVCLLQPLISSNCHTASLKISVEIENNKIKWGDELWVYNAIQQYFSVLSWPSVLMVV